MRLQNEFIKDFYITKATYMYWQKRFDRIDLNKKIEKKILAIHNEHKDFGYRRMQAIHLSCKKIA